MKRMILSSAQRRSDILDELESHGRRCMEALAQLYLFPNYIEYRNHWRREVWSHYESIDTVKKSHKYPKSSDIYDYIWGMNKHRFDWAVEAAKEHEYQLKPDQSRENNLDTLYSIMSHYFKWVADTLSSRGQIFPQECYRKLDSLGL